MNKEFLGVKSALFVAFSIFMGLLFYDIFKNISLGILSLLGDLTLAILLSLIIFYLFEPIVSYLEMLGVSRGLSTILLFLLIAGISFALLVFFIPYLIEESKGLKHIDISRYMKEINKFADSLDKNIQILLPVKVKFNVGEKITQFIEIAGKNTLNLITSFIPQMIGLLITVPFFSFFFLRDSTNFKNWLLELVPNKYFETTLDIIYNINRQMGAFIRGKFLESFIVAVATFLVLLPTKIKYNVFLSLFSGLCNLIPYVGPIIGVIPVIVVGLADFSSINPLIYSILAYFIIVQGIVDNLIVIPLLIAKVADLHPFLVLISIIAGGKFMGVIGMFIGVPVASIIKIIVEEIYYYYKYQGIRIST